MDLLEKIYITHIVGYAKPELQTKKNWMCVQGRA